MRRVEKEGLHRTVCDYIAGMTDRYVMEEYARIAGRGGQPNSLRECDRQMRVSGRSRAKPTRRRCRSRRVNI